MQGYRVNLRSLGVAPYVVAVTFFMENLDGTVIATALPAIGRSLGVGPADLAVGMSAYLLTLAVFIPVSGWIANRYGARTVFASAIAVFTFASILCGAATEFWSFVGARILQGIGAAMMTPVGRMVVMRSTPKPLMMQAISTITWPGLLAPVLGPPVGGYITTYASWRWIFYLNVPIGLVAILLVLRYVDNEKADAKRAFDRVGFVLTGVAMGGLMYAFDELGRPHGNLLTAALILAGSLAAGTLAVRHALGHPTPILDLSPRKIPVYRLNIFAGSFFRIGINAIPFLAPLLLQVGFGMTAFEAGSLLLIGAAGDLAMKTVTTPILRAFGFRTVLTVNCIAIVIMTLAFNILTPSSSHWLIGAVLVLYGMCRSMGFTAHNALSVSDVPPPLIGAASTLTAMLMQTSLGMGIAYGSIALHLGDWLAGDGGGTPVLAAFRIAFLAAAAASACALVGYWRLDRFAGSEISGHKPA
jgi:EmrB/QacA subfamily drug resistance transporter